MQFAPGVDTRGDTRARAEFEFHKWQLIHKIIHDHPFRVKSSQPRADQWRDVLAIIRDIDEMELIDWVLLQIEVAENLAKGVQDMRPRKNGPCHPLLLEYTGNRKRHALAVLHFARDGEKEGLYTVNSSWHSKTEKLLPKSAGRAERECGGHEGVPWNVPEQKT
jgi:hypothetical protein